MAFNDAVELSSLIILTEDAFNGALPYDSFVFKDGGELPNIETEAAKNSASIGGAVFRTGIQFESPETEAAINGYTSDFPIVVNRFATPLVVPAALPITIGDDSFEVSYLNPVIANFTAEPLSSSVPFTVDFTDLSLNDPTAWLWDFGDGGTSTEQHPSHTYRTIGLKTVSLTVYGGEFQDTIIKETFISCLAPIPPPRKQYAIVLSNKSPYPYNLGTDSLVSRIEVVTDRTPSYVQNARVELWLNWTGDWVKYNEGTTNRYGYCVFKTHTNPAALGISNCLGYAKAFIEDQTWISNPIRYNFYESAGRVAFEIDAHSGSVDRSSFDVFDGYYRTIIYDRMV